ncbi:MAG: Vacuolar protein sorting-associated protein 8 [Pycnora praestabilis]|nr:MAG: Vacuolar protein sorting-associated protein 8 [Pycnora praestabilis]
MSSLQEERKVDAEEDASDSGGNASPNGNELSNDESIPGNDYREGTSRVMELLEEERIQGQEASIPNGRAFNGYGIARPDDGCSQDEHPLLAMRPMADRKDSIEGSLSTPDDTPSIHGSVLSSPESSGLASHTSNSRLSPTLSLRPFDQRFRSRISSSPVNSPRTLSPAFLSAHSRQSSYSSQLFRDHIEPDSGPTPWEVVRWTKLKKISAQAFSEAGKRSFGKPTCISISASIALGTAKGIILIFDYHQTLKSIIGPGTKAVECGSITSLATSADHTAVAGGHANGSLFTWDISKPSRPFLHIQPLEAIHLQNRSTDGHVSGAAILHIGFLGTRHTALVSADDRGMAFSHMAARGLGAVGRNVKSTRVLGRYPNDMALVGKPRKPSSVLAFSPLPLGNVEQPTDAMGLTAMLTPYLLVIVSTTPLAQTQHKAARPKEVAAHGAMSACLAWFPAVKLKIKEPDAPESISKAKLAYCWSNVLTVLDVLEVEPDEMSRKDTPPSLQFRPRSRWKGEEAIVAVQWLTRLVLGVLTITQRLIILEDDSLRMTESFDLIQKQIFHHDTFSRQLQPLVEQLDDDDDDTSMHGVVADAFHMSFKVYKSRMFLLGFNDVSIGTLSNWADRLLAFMEQGDFIGAIQLATSYYNGEADKLTVGLPEDSLSRHSMVQEKLLEMMSASLKYAFGRNQKAGEEQVEQTRLEELASACFLACISMDDMDFLYDDVYAWYEDSSVETIFLETLEPYILNAQIKAVPPSVMKALITHFTSKGLDSRLEEMICHMGTRTMDIDQLTALCKQHNLYDALIYVWNQALNDYVTPLIDLLKLVTTPLPNGGGTSDQPSQVLLQSVNALKIFPYLSYILTSRVYPSGEILEDQEAAKAKAELYHFIFSGKPIPWPQNGGQIFLPSARSQSRSSYPYLRMILKFDAASFMSALNEAFEDNFLNGMPERIVNDGGKGNSSENQKFGSSVNRQYIVSILLEVMSPSDFDAEDTIYLDMFIARNLPKFPQFILLSGTALHRVLVGLCNYPSDDIADDCQLSVEYLLSVYHPPDLESLIPLFTQARFYRVLKSVYRVDKQYAKLLQTFFDDHENRDAIFDCIGDCLRPRTGLSSRQVRDVRTVLERNARELANIDIVKTAKTVSSFSPDLHATMLGALEADPKGQFVYLRTILESAPKSPGDPRIPQGAPNHAFVEQYVRLMCDFNPSHVANYIGMLQIGDLRLDQVLPAMESGGVVDAAVVLMAREGQIQEAMVRLTKHLDTLEAALLGVMNAATDNPDVENNVEATEELLEGLQKYAGVGIWLCQGQMKTALKSRATVKQPKRTSSTTNQQLSSEERLWLDLIDTIVRITKEVSLSPHDSSSDTVDDSAQPSSRLPLAIDSSKIVTSLRTIVQQAFTALLSTTTTTASIPSPNRNDHTFLRILRAFLTRASLSSPSLSDLRSVLAAIFSAYAYEESLLALANRLLDKDLFVHVAEATNLRQKGWAPKNQTCEGCGRRVWGPGAGGRIWDAWEEKREEEERTREAQLADRASGQVERKAERGKGKAVEEKMRRRSDSRSSGEGVDEARHSGDGEEDLGPLIIFSCRHIVHRKCLERLRAKDDDVDTQEDTPHGAGRQPEFRCLICI